MALSLLSVLFVSLHVASIFGAAIDFPRDTSDTQLQVNVLIGQNNASAVQCWAVEPPFTISSQAGTVGAKIQAIGDTTGSTVIFFDPDNNIDAGLHNAPAAQWVMTLQGSGVVTLPATNKSVSLPQGSIIIAADTADVSAIGHETHWAKGSVVAQLPFTGGQVPGHTIVNAHGTCEDAQSAHSARNPAGPAPCHD